MLVASILVYIQRNEGRIQDVSLEALGVGRRIGTTLGATVHAFIHASLVEDTEEDWVQVLGQAGADKVLVAGKSSQPGPVRWSAHGPSLQAAITRIDPLLIIMTAGHVADELGARLATRLGSDFVARPAVEFHEHAVTLRHTSPDRQRWRSISIADLPPSSVITLTPGHHQRAHGLDEADTMNLPPPDHVPPMRRSAPVTYIGSAPDPGTALSSAPIIVAAGGGVDSPAAYDLLAELARAVEGQLAATETLYERGLAPLERVVGAGLRHVAPRLYIACGASGSPRHLHAISPDTRILAINNDRDAPIFDIADYGIVGDLETIVPKLLESFQQMAELLMSETIQ